MGSWNGTGGRGYMSAGSPAGYGHVAPYLPRYGPSVLSGLPPQLTGARVRMPQGPPPREPSQRERTEQLIAAFGCEPAAGLKALADYICVCLARELHNTQIGARLPGNQGQPPKAVGFNGSAGFSAVAPVSLPAGGAFDPVLAMTPRGKRSGAIRFLNVQVTDPAFLPLVEWRITVNGTLWHQFFGPLDGDGGGLAGPFDIAVFRGSQLLIEARNTGPGPVDVTAVALGWQFMAQHWEPRDWQQFMVDGG